MVRPDGTGVQCKFSSPLLKTLVLALLTTDGRGKQVVHEQGADGEVYDLLMPELDSTCPLDHTLCSWWHMSR